MHLMRCEMELPAASCDILVGVYREVTSSARAPRGDVGLANAQYAPVRTTSTTSTGGRHITGRKYTTGRRHSTGRQRSTEQKLRPCQCPEGTRSTSSTDADSRRSSL
jgi:hypothetical protein